MLRLVRFHQPFLINLLVMTFHQRIQHALDNDFLQGALTRNHERRVGGRHARFAELPHAEAVRDAGRAIRLHTLRHLDRYLDQFATQVAANGGQVHWAATAEEARLILHDLIRQAAQGRDQVVVAKSKSMVSEEIHLNHALETAGMQVVETDLGEFIVQLRHETPAHIITPAVHLRREDVSDLFSREFGMPPTLDVAAMTAVAQKELRQTYFRADVGITGVNFGVAQTGSVAVVTNEGNADLTMTVPRVHIALMGLERLVPTLNDLEVMLRLLPRSATAQKLTSYVSLVSGPRRPDEPHGPDEFHVVLVDNGRSATLGSELAEALLCIRCGACLNVCPVFQSVGGHAYGAPYSGPIGSVVSPALLGPQFNELANASSLCGACQDICPVRIDIPTLLLRVRARSVQANQPPLWLRWGMKAFAVLMRSPLALQAAQVVGAWGTKLLARLQGGRIRTLPGPLAAWTDHRDFPTLPAQSFRARWHARGRAHGRAHTPTQP